MSTVAHERFDYGTHWVSEQIERGVFGLSNPLLVSVVKFSLVWDVLALTYTALYWEQLSVSFAYASALGLLWVNVAPYLIWYYDERVLPMFFGHLSELLSDESTRAELAEKYTTFFARHRLSVSLFWGGIAVALIFVSEPVLRAHGMTGPGEPFLWTSYLYAAYVGGVLGHGFVGPLTTLLLIRELTEHDLEIDPLHPDNLGGLSTVGYASIRTTLLYSTGSLFLPLLFYFVSAGSARVVVFLFVGIYVASIFVSFAYPTVIVNRRAQSFRDAKLEELRQQYAAIESETSDPGRDDVAELNKRLELQRVQQKYERYNSVSLYPLQMSILTRLAGSVFLPIAFMLIELYLPSLL